MAVETDDDRAIFFDPDDFGGVATVTIAGTGETFDVEGIYTGPHLTRGVKQDNQFTSSVSVDVSMQKPEFRTRSSVLPGVKNGRATILIGDPFFSPPALFSVWDVEPDGTGMTVLCLKKA